MPRRFAASTRAWPAMIPLAPSRRMGLVQPNSLRDAGIWPTWVSEWVRAFRAYGSSSATGLYLTFSVLVPLPLKWKPLSTLVNPA